ncbi:FecR domain-containing protein [Dongia sp.]|uniref:FecR family protein n=1 Tax=Dongia sp. TaxID=1977262 RepID=UPI0035AEA57E
MAQAAVAAPRIGAVVQPEYNGAVAAPNGSTASHAILYRDEVFALDTVKTGASASTELEFLDETTVQVGAGAELRLDNFVYDASSTQGSGQISFTVGAFRYIGGKMTTEENVRLRTPAATMVIRGTELVIYVWPDGQTEVNVISGAVEISDCASGGGRLAMTGMQITVMPDCTTHVAAARSLPSDMAALALPDRSGDATEDGEDEGGRDGHDGADGGEGRDRPSHSNPGNNQGNNKSGGPIN